MPATPTLNLGSMTITGNPNSSVPFWLPDNSILANLPFNDGTNGFYTAPTAWDILMVAGQPLPGLVRVMSGFPRKKLKLQSKARPGSDGASQTFLGYNPVLFNFELFLWTPLQLSYFQSALQDMFPGKGTPITKTTTMTTQQQTVTPSTGNFTPANAVASGPNGETLILTTQPTTTSSTKTVGYRPQPVQVQHPALQLHGVTSVIFLEMEGPYQWKPDHMPDIFLVRFKTEQFLPPKNVNVTTAATSLPTRIANNPPVTPQNAAVSPAANGGAAPNSGGASGTW